MTAGDLQVLVPPERSPMAALSGTIAAITAGGLAVAFALDEGLGVTSRFIALGAGGLVAASLGAGARLLWRARGGIFWDPSRRGLGIGLTHLQDVLWLPVEEITGLAVECLSDQDQERPVWSMLVHWRGHADVLLMEGHDLENLETCASEIGAIMGLSSQPEEIELSEPGTGRLTFGVQTGVALQALLALLGLALLVVGSILVPQYREQPVFAIFFGPVLVFLGGTLLALDLLKRLCLETLEHQGGLWTHGFRLGAWTWGHRAVSAPRPRWVIRPLGLKGAHLEMIGPQSVLILGSGATTVSSTSITALCRLPTAFREAQEPG